jgi:hypothetical protein
VEELYSFLEKAEVFQHELNVSRYQVASLERKLKIQRDQYEAELIRREAWSRKASARLIIAKRRIYTLEQDIRKMQAGRFFNNVAADYQMDSSSLASSDSVSDVKDPAQCQESNEDNDSDDEKFDILAEDRGPGLLSPLADNMERLAFASVDVNFDDAPSIDN